MLMRNVIRPMSKLVPVLKATVNSIGTLRPKVLSKECTFRFMHVQINACNCSRYVLQASIYDVFIVLASLQA